MLVPILALVIALMIAVAIGVFAAKRHVYDGERKPDIRPDDPRPATGALSR